MKSKAAFFIDLEIILKLGFYSFNLKFSKLKLCVFYLQNFFRFENQNLDLVLPSVFSKKKFKSIFFLVSRSFFFGLVRSRILKSRTFILAFFLFQSSSVMN